MQGLPHFAFRDAMSDAEMVQRIQHTIDEDFNRSCHGTLWGRKTSGLTPLILAITQNKTATAAILLQIPGIDINAETTHGDTALTCAIQKEDSSMVRRLLEAGAKIENEKKKAIQVALRMGPKCEQFVDILLEFGANFKGITLKQGGGNVWFCAVCSKHFPLLKEQGHDINYVDPELGTPLYDLLKFMDDTNSPYLCDLLEHGADPHIRHPTINLLPIHRTIARGHVGLSMQLLRATKQEIPDLVENGLLPLIRTPVTSPDDNKIKKMIEDIFLSPLYAETFRRYTEDATLIKQTALINTAIQFAHLPLADYLFYELGLPMVAQDIKDIRRLFCYVLSRNVAQEFVWLYQHAPCIPEGSCFSELLDGPGIQAVQPPMFRILVSYIPDYRPSDQAISDAFVKRDYIRSLEMFQIMLSLFPTGVPIREYPSLYSYVLSTHRSAIDKLSIGGVDMLAILEKGLPSETQQAIQIQTNGYRNQLLLDETLDRQMLRCFFKLQSQKLLEDPNPKRTREESPLIVLSDDDAVTNNSPKRQCRS